MVFTRRSSRRVPADVIDSPQEDRTAREFFRLLIISDEAGAGSFVPATCLHGGRTWAEVAREPVGTRRLAMRSGERHQV